MEQYIINIGPEEINKHNLLDATIFAEILIHLLMFTYFRLLIQVVIFFFFLVLILTKVQLLRCNVQVHGK